MTATICIVSINVGRPQIIVRRDRRLSSAIGRRPVDGPINLTADGLAGDRVSDQSVHGGPDKAVCCYPAEHYDYWRNELGLDMPLPSFGENLTISGLPECEACIGDSFRAGDAVLQISQPRQPCAKLAMFIGRPDMPRLVTAKGYSGYYVRVLRPGRIAPGDELRLSDRPHPDFTVARTNRLRLEPTSDPDGAAALSSIAELSQSWRDHFAERLDKIGGNGG